MRKLILIALIFSLQILQGQVSIEKVWEKYFDDSIISYSNSLNDSSLLVTYYISGGTPPTKTFVNKLDSYNSNIVESVKSYVYSKVFFNYNNNPFLALSYPLQTACYLNLDNNYDSLYCLERYFAAFGSISYKNSFFILYPSLGYQDTIEYQDSILRFSIHNIVNNKDVKKLKIKTPRKYAGNPSVFYSQQNKFFIVSSTSYTIVNNISISKPVIDIFNENGNLITSIDDVFNYYTNRNAFDLNNVFHFYDNEKYLIYFTQTGLTKYNLQTFEKTEILSKTFYEIKYSAISQNEKYMLVSSYDSLSYIDLTTLEITLLSKDLFTSIEISNSNDYFYGIKKGESGTLYKYRIKTPTSIKEEEKESNIFISPNPTSDFINIAGVEPETRLELANIFSETVWSGIGAKQISTQALPNGTYFLKTTQGSQIKSQKVLVWR